MGSEIVVGVVAAAVGALISFLLTYAMERRRAREALAQQHRDHEAQMRLALLPPLLEAINRFVATAQRMTDSARSVLAGLEMLPLTSTAAVTEQLLTHEVDLRKAVPVLEGANTEVQRLDFSGALSEDAENLMTSTRTLAYGLTQMAVIVTRGDELIRDAGEATELLDKKAAEMSEAVGQSDAQRARFEQRARSALSWSRPSVVADSA